MDKISELFAQGFEQAVITEPAVTNDYYVNAGKVLSDLNYHLDSLLKFGLEGDDLAWNDHIVGFGIYGLFGQIESLCKGETSPSSFDEL